jgi:hypothetical protein
MADSTNRRTRRSAAAKPATAAKRSPAKPATNAKRTAAKRTPKPKGFVAPASAVRASSVTPKKIDWLGETGIPQGMISLVAGRPGQGKSMFSAWLAAEVSQNAHVIFSNLEDLQAEVSRPRLEAAGAKLDRVHFWTPQIESDAGLAELRSYIEQFKVKLLTLDPIAAHVKASIWNDQAIRQVLSPLKEQVLEPTGCACLILAHTTKKIAKSAHPLEAIGGSGGGLVGASRAVFVFGPNPSSPEERILASAKPNLRGHSSVAFEIDENDITVGKLTFPAPRLVLTDPDAGVGAGRVLSYNAEDEGEPDPVKTAVATEWLTSYLMFGARPAVEIREDGIRAGFTWTTLRRAGQEKIGVLRLANPNGTGQVWQLPQGHPALMVANIAQPMFDAQQIEVVPGQLTVEDVLRMIDEGQRQNGGDAS